ncbi:MAG: hypothetical protein JWO42_1684, partial [Chloroflexi bacterium]|nr:hypothetical protein [Chloroflexota bacterium]
VFSSRVLRAKSRPANGCCCARSGLTWPSPWHPPRSALALRAAITGDSSSKFSGVCLFRHLQWLTQRHLLRNVTTYGVAARRQIAALQVGAGSKRTLWPGGVRVVSAYRAALLRTTCLYPGGPQRHAGKVQPPRFTMQQPRAYHFARPVALLRRPMPRQSFLRPPFDLIRAGVLAQSKQHWLHIPIPRAAG